MGQLNHNTTPLQCHLDATYLHALYGGKLSTWLQLVAWGDSTPYASELADGVALGFPCVGCAWFMTRRGFGIR
jgi:hypothetical protein